jgi:hypothetical protein
MVNLEFVKTLLLKSSLNKICVLAGLLLLLLGAVKLVKVPVLGPLQASYPATLMWAGGVLMVVGVIWEIVRAVLVRKDRRESKAAIATRGPAAPTASDYDVRIISPADGSLIDDEQVKGLRGTMKRGLPAGYALWLVRRFASTPDVFLPMKRAEVKLMRGSLTEHEWEVDAAYVGGNKGGNDPRIIEAWLVGPDGQRMLDAVKKANEQHARLMQHTKTPWDKEWQHDPLPSQTSDMVLGTRITVTRR